MILIDLDGVITNTIKMFVELNNEINGFDSDWREVCEWNFGNVCPNLKTDTDINELFRYKKLYENPVFFPHAIDVINRLNKKYEVAICTMGDNYNIINKLHMLNKYLPDINVITVSNEIKDKGFMECDILLDDHIKNLQGKSLIPVLFEPYQRYDWNEGWKGIVIKNWLDFERVVNMVYGE